MDDNEPIVAAALRGDLEELRRLMGEGADIYTLGVEMGAEIELALKSNDATQLPQRIRMHLQHMHPHEHHRRARELAQSVGEVVGGSTAYDASHDAVAWGLHVENVSALGGAPVILGVSREDPTVVLLALDDAHPLTCMILVRELARLYPGDLVAGRELEVAPIAGQHPSALDFRARVRLEPPSRLHGHLDVDGVIVAMPVGVRTCATQLRLDKLARCVTRWKRLRELNAPDSICCAEIELIARTHRELLAGGWDPVEDPLAADVTELLDELLSQSSSGMPG